MVGSSHFLAASSVIERASWLDIRVVLVAAFALVFLCLLGATLKTRSTKHFSATFLMICCVVVISTGVMMGEAVYLMARAEPHHSVRYEAGIEYWACGVQLDIADPQMPLSNKIGTPSFHEHDDDTMHYEGMVIERSDTSLGRFQNAIGGTISTSDMTLPVSDTVLTLRTDGDTTDPSGILRVQPFVSTNATGQKIVSLENGQRCGDYRSELQVYVYSMNPDGISYTQKKLNSPFLYEITPADSVPNGDCIIVEFDIESPRTDRLCKGYGQRDTARCLDFGVAESAKDSCDIHEVLPTGESR